MERFARTVLRHGRWVFVIWLVVLVAGGAAAGQLSNRLKFDFSLPGQEGYETEVKLAKAYGTASYASYIPVISSTDGSPIATHEPGVAAIGAALRELPGLRVLDYAGTKDKAFLTADGRSTFMLVYAPQVQGFVDPLAPRVQEVFQKSAAANGLTVRVTGYNELQAGSDSNDGPSILVETLIGAGGALVVLLFVFASFLALVPLLVAAVSILATFLIVLALTTFTDISFVVQFLISLVGLGVAIDYSLLVISRWREERGPRGEQRRGCRHRRAHGRRRRPRLGSDRGDQPDLAGRRPGALDPQHGVRRDADPGREHPGRAHAAAGAAARGRAAGRLATDPPRGRRLARLVRLGPHGDQVPVGGGGGRRCGSRHRDRARPSASRSGRPALRRWPRTAWRTTRWPT